MNPSLRCVIQTRDQLGETPLWCPRTHMVWWIDIEQPKLHSFDERTGAHAAGRTIVPRAAHATRS